MVRYLMGGLVIGLLFGGGMNTILADENEVTITRTEYETLLQQVQDTKSDTEKILEILEGKQTNEAKEGGESEETPSSYSRSGGEVNDTNDNDSGEEGMSSNGVEAEETNKEVDKIEEPKEEPKGTCKGCDKEFKKSELNDKGICKTCNDTKAICPKCSEYHSKSDIEEGECYNFHTCESCGKEDVITSKAYEEGQRECDSCKNKPKVKVDEELPTQESPATESEDIPQPPQIETTICPKCEQEYTVGEHHECPRILCPTCEQEYTVGEYHECPRIVCAECGEVYKKGEHHECPLIQCPTCGELHLRNEKHECPLIQCPTCGELHLRNEKHECPQL